MILSEVQSDCWLVVVTLIGSNQQPESEPLEVNVISQFENLVAMAKMPEMF